MASALNRVLYIFLALLRHSPLYYLSHIWGLPITVCLLFPLIIRLDKSRSHIIITYLSLVNHFRVFDRFYF